jgi:4-carboxymuconolactone decarboxylase
MDPDTYEKGREIRTAVLGKAYVAAAESNADEFSKPLQDLVTEYCWGAVWGREGLTLKTRSMLNLAIADRAQPSTRIAHSRQGRADQRCVARRDPRILLQAAIYAGVPAAVDSFRVAREAFAEIEQE